MKVLVLLDVKNVDLAKFTEQQIGKRLDKALGEQKIVEKVWKVSELVEFTGSKHHKGLLLDALDPTVLVLGRSAGLVKA